MKASKFTDAQKAFVIKQGVSAVSANGTDLRLRFKEDLGFVVVTKERIYGRLPRKVISRC